MYDFESVCVKWPLLTLGKALSQCCSINSVKVYNSEATPKMSFREFEVDVTLC